MKISNKYTRAIGSVLLFPFVLVIVPPLVLAVWTDGLFKPKCGKHPWFAWHPVMVGFENGNQGVYVWLETIDREWWGGAWHYERRAAT